MARVWMISTLCTIHQDMNNLAADSHGNLFVSSSSRQRAKNNGIYQVSTKSGEWKLIAGSEYNTGDRSGPLKSSRFKFPTGLTVEECEGGTILWVADCYNHRVRRVDLKADMVSSPLFSISYPYAVTMNKSKLFVADLKQLYKVTFHSNSLICESSIGYAASECQLTSDHTGQCVYLSSYHEIFRIDCNTMEMKELTCKKIEGKPDGEKFGCIKGIALDKDDRNMYVVDASKKKLYVLELNTMEAKLVAQNFTHPGSITMDKHGFLYMIDAKTIHKFSPPRLEWKAERLLWIGNRKNQPQDCPLAKLPQEMIREIVKAF